MTALRIRDLKLGSVTEHRRSLLDGSVRTAAQIRAEMRREHGDFVRETFGDAAAAAAAGQQETQRQRGDDGVDRRNGNADDVGDDEDDNDELECRRHMLLQVRFVTPVRGVSALAVKATDRDTMLQIKARLLEQLHELPEPSRPPDAVIASCGSRYFQRQSIVNTFRAGIATAPQQLLFFVDERDECLPDRATLFELGFESPPLVSVFCATDHLWLRLRGYPERYSVPWHLHMTEVELAKEVLGVFKPEDMRLVRAVFYRDPERLRRSRTWRRPATEAPPLWTTNEAELGGGRRAHFGAFESEESFASASGEQNQQQKQTSAAGVLEPVVVPLHEWCRVPPPPRTRVDPALTFEQLRRQAALLRADLVRGAFGQASDSWYALPADVLRLAEPDAAVEHVPRALEFTRTRDGRKHVFRAEVSTARDGVEQQDTSQPVGALAEAVVDHCDKTNPTEQSPQQRGGSSSGDADDSPTRGPRNDHHHDDHRYHAAGGGGGDRNSPSVNMSLQFQVSLLSWEPQLVRTGNVLATGEDELVPHTHPQLFLPFDDDDEQLSPFGRKEIHDMWDPAAMPAKYPFLQGDFFFHQRRADVPVEALAEMLRRDVRLFLGEALRFTFNRPETRRYNDSRSQLQQKEPGELVEFDNTSLPRHLSDYGICNGSEVFVEFFSVHTQQWSGDVAHDVHERMREALNLQLLQDRALARQYELQQQQQRSAVAAAVGRRSEYGEDGEGMSSSSSSSLSMRATPMRGKLTSRTSGGAALREQQRKDSEELLLGGTDVIEKRKRRIQTASSGGNRRRFGGLAVGFSALPEDDDEDAEERPSHSRRTADDDDDDDDDEEGASKIKPPVAQRKKALSGQFRELLLSKRRRDAELRASGFVVVNVRTYRGVLLRVPVLFETATVEDVLDLVLCATGDVPMFSVVVSPQGALLSPWTRLCELERNPGLLHLRILRRPRPWCDETLETVARAASRKQPHLD